MTRTRTPDPGGRLWAITCLFNPAGYRVRTGNYRIFRRHLRVPLATVELAFDEPFCLGPGDADVLVQLRGGGRMWQKERLLTLAERALPPHCNQVMWIDADVIVHDPNWPEEVGRALETSAVVQPFSMVRQLAPAGVRVPRKPSTVAAMQAAESRRELLDSALDRDSPSPSSGLVWAARREILARHGLYDSCIVGGGDTAFLCAAFGCGEDVVHLHNMGPAQTRRYLAWAKAVYEDVRGDVTCLPHEIEHQWHGRMQDRQARQRHLDLRKIGFDPFNDLTLGKNGAWEWGSDRPELHRFVAEYFALRNEDSFPISDMPFQESVSSPVEDQVEDPAR